MNPSFYIRNLACMILSESEDKSGTKKSVVCILLVVTAILFIRKTDSFTNPQFWAEDGTIFFYQQLISGASSALEPYAGYLHLAPRLIAIIADLFPYSITPVIYNYSSLGLTLFVVLYIFSPRLKCDKKLVMALAIVLVPHPTNEVFVNVTNIQWTLCLLLIVTLLKDNPDRAFGNINLQRIIDCSILILCGLTGPFVILAAPLFLCKYFRKKDSYTGLIFLLILTLSAVQLFFIMKTSVPAAGQGVYSIDHWSKVIGQKLFGNLFLGHIISYQINAVILSVFCISLPFLLLSFSLGEKKRLFLISTYLYFGIAVAVSSFYKFKGNPLALVPLENGPRYFYVPYVMLTWSLISCLSLHEKWKKVTVLSLLFLILISSLSSGFRSHPYKDYNWGFYSEKIGEGQKVHIPINPQGWFVTIENVTEYK